ncbi:SDR family NAD(P)-dependent oxidoreductase [Pseudooceanicola aestuarii]|uniref:SDR family NAD(P)-dependent oxidoreductase n=1 Tax=Pseudooceanicola aestuarii TaxID=2697319 RepID=UPI001953FAA9|nr:SDR family oxidoreductase [Pseudooceanicola aestuarii]
MTGTATGSGVVPMFDLAGKVALVTGGNGGIGLGMARGLAQAGADVVIWGQNPDKTARAEAELTALGGRVQARRVDVTDEQAVNEGVAAALAEFGRLDFVAANAGTGAGGGPFHDITQSDWRALMTVNLDSVMWLFRAACRHMTDRAAAGDPGGSLLVSSSIAALNSPPMNQAYAASKAGVIAMIKSIAVEYGRHGIRANAVLPGFVRSDLSQALQEAEKFNDRVIRGRVPLGRWGEPEDFAGLAVYLASDMSRFHTGDALVLDGALTIT